MMVEDEKESRHKRKVSKTKLDQKTFNMSSLMSHQKNTVQPRRRISMEPNIFINNVDYKTAINFVKIDKKFMLKEHLMSITVFPWREWLVSKKKHRVTIDQTPIITTHSEYWRIIVFIIIGIVVLFVGSLLYALISSIRDFN